jgi:dihydrofolate reductase
MGPCFGTPELWWHGLASCKTSRMGKLIYSAHTSLDGYTVDAAGSFDFTAPDEEVHAFVNDRERGIGTYLFGRRMYETMSIWETWDTTTEPRVVRDYQTIWSRANKIVYSHGLHTVGTRLTRIERAFVPDEVRALKERAPENLGIGGAMLAGTALRAGLVDEVQLFLSPVVVGGGTRALPDDVRLNLELLAENRFASGVVSLRYAVRP